MVWLEVRVKVPKRKRAYENGKQGKGEHVENRTHAKTRETVRSNGKTAKSYEHNKGTTTTVLKRIEQ